MTTIIDDFDQKLDAIAQEVTKQEYWKEFTSSHALEAGLRLEVMKHIMREISTYQIEVNRAVFTAVGRLGNKISQQALIRSMIAVQIEEVGHGTVALNDFYALGGSEDEANELPSPSSLAVIAVVRHLGDNHNPLCHLGFMYFFEKFTTIITEMGMPYLKEAGYPNDSLQFMRLHAEEDVRHAHMLADTMEAAIKEFPDAEMHMRYGFDCFYEVYPHNLWKAAFEKTKQLKYA